MKLKEKEEDVKILKGDKITDGWLRRFMERDDKLCLWTRDSTTANVQMDSVKSLLWVVPVQVGRLYLHMWYLI